MAKGAKKKNRKLRRQIRKTVGALLMVSAITVAAIPVQDVGAAYPGNTDGMKPEKIKVAVTSKHGEIDGTNTTVEKPCESLVPYVRDQKEDPNNQVIYTSGNGMFKFAYIRGDGIVILDYADSSSRDTVEIPEQLEAYRSYSLNYQGQEYYCLVSANDELLGYKLKNQPLVNDKGDYLYETIDMKPDGATIENRTELTELQLEKDPDGSWWFNYMQQKRDEDGQVVYDEKNQPVMIPARAACRQSMGDRYYPCYYNTRDVWGSIDQQDLYYHPKVKDGSGNDTKADNYDVWEQAKGNTVHWGIKAAVRYIGAENIKTVGTGWELVGDTENNPYRDTPGEGVFAGTIYLKKVIIDAKLVAVSDYAFYNCPQLATINFQPGLNTVGNGVFAECIGLNDVTMPEAYAIGKDAFYNCQSLRNFNIPTGTLRYLGDCAFEGCTSLVNVDFLPEPGTDAVALKYLGNHLFRNCSSLIEMEFPKVYHEDEALDIDMFQGCTALQRVILPDGDANSSGANIVFDCHHSENGTDYPNCTGNTWEEFRKTVPDSFYFEGPAQGRIHNIANDNSITYKYPNEQLYERVVFEHDKKDDKDWDVKNAKVFYKVRVDSNGIGHLEAFETLDYDYIDGTDTKKWVSQPDIITIPEKIGTFGISSIEEGSFSNNCDLIKVTIPASVTRIGANAFKGCHDLRTVIFTDASTIEADGIGANAFKTQDVLCEHKSKLYPAKDAEEPYLYFVGAMLKEDGSDTETFKFATSGADSSKISHSNSKDIWITCHSGWPTNLEVEYYSDPMTKTGEARLVGYPRYDIINGNPSQWVKNLPYLTAGSTEADEYLTMVNRALQSNGGTAQMDPPLTPNEADFVAAMLDVTIPKNVDSIEPGLFSGYDGEGNEIEVEVGKNEAGDPIIVKGADKSIRSITINGVDTLEPYTFKGCTNLKSASIIGSRFIDDYAFEDCEGLADTSLGSNLEDTGKRPFKGCENLMSINCLDPSNFTYDSGILYRNINGGKEIVECLENRGTTGGTGLYTVGPDELEGVTAIKEEAFAECKDVAQVDLSKTSISAITEGSFKEMELNSIVLPKSLSRIDADAFKDNDVKRFVVYYKNSNPITMTPNAFEPKDGDPNERGKREVIFQCSIPSNAATYAEDYKYITSSDEEVFEEFEVRFYNTPDYPASTNLELLSTQQVKAGEDAAEPSTEGLTCNTEGLKFIGWDKPFTNVRGELNVLAMYGTPKYEVSFIDGYNGDVLKTETVSAGGTATPPDPIPEHPGYIFSGWDKPHYDINENTRIVGRYVDASGDASRFTVSFYLEDGDEEPWWETHAANGEVIMGPMPPAKQGYTFVRWIWAPASSEKGVKQDTSVYAQWTPNNGSNNPNDPNNPNNPNNPNSSASPKPNSSASPSASTSPSPSSSPEVTKYTVSVSGGSGSGQYAAGEIVAVNAYYMGEGQAFDRWTTSTAGVGFSNPNATSATFTMPAANVAVTATYKTGSGASTASAGGGGTGAGGGAGGSGTTSNNGTSVEITKPGISNTNLAGATVSGATDNFIVKVTEDQSATNAVVAALQARYGDISRIKYLPMDISLYDSTGRVKIADTSGITVNLTMPIPDDLVQYAGNNKVAAISNGALEDLNVRFTTVGGVPCVNFTATHFSPYVIYVDTANLTEATIDATPKTGDPIHPKWFLALGLACVSLILFFKRDKKVVINTKTA